MYREAIEHLIRLAEAKANLLRRSPGGFFVAAMMAGAYVGVGIVLIFVLGSAAPEEWRRLVMGASFGIALTLVVVAGSELFTGHNLYMALGHWAQRVTAADVFGTWVVSWVGNLTGAFVLAMLVAAGGGAGLLAAPDGLLQQVAEYKMRSPAAQLVARAALCNWLVCLALWMSARVSSEAARMIAIWWCLLAFIACGFEHSVANMTLLALALLGPHGEGVSPAGMAHNLLWVTLGNVVGGTLFVAGGYWFVSRERAARSGAPERTG